MATAKQLAARKLFAARAKAGFFSKGPKAAEKRKYEREKKGRITDIEAAEAALRLARKHAARKSNPTKKRAAKSVTRKSQITGKPPTKRLKTRRTIAAKRPVRGYFPNPAPVSPWPKSTGRFAVQYHKRISGQKSGRWITIATFHAQSMAEDYARALHKLGTYGAIRVEDNASK